MSWFTNYKKKVFYRAFIRWFNRVSLPGLEKVPIGAIVKYFTFTFQYNDISMRASAMAFNFFLALFPAAIFFFTLIAFIPIGDFHKEIMSYLSTLIPTSAFKAVEKTLTDILKNQHGGLLSFGFFSAMVFASNAFFNMFKAFSLYDSAEEKRTELKRRLLSLYLTLLLSLAVVIAIALFTVGQYGLNWMAHKHYISDKFTYYTLVVVKWAFTIFLYQLVIASMYYFGSTVKRKFDLLNPGILLATAFTIGATAIFAYYVNNFNSYNKLYGSIGTLLVILLLIYFNALIILYGYELNAALEKLKEKKINPETITAEQLEKEVVLENKPIKE
ncbi:MAG: YihY/virulence factor BrkB family protein [Bacteroidota bacterium]|nr:YihY/virulence factor BrkB family protein [Bacteroidota bacterium]